MQQFNDSSFAFLSQLIGMTFTMFFLVGIFIYLAVALGKKMFITIQMRKRVSKVNKFLIDKKCNEDENSRVVYNEQGIPVIFQTSQKLFIL